MDYNKFVKKTLVLTRLQILKVNKKRNSFFWLCAIYNKQANQSAKFNRWGSIIVTKSDKSDKIKFKKPKDLGVNRNFGLT